MTDTRREIERKYASEHSGLPDLTGVGGIASVVDHGVEHLDAVYWDTPDGRLAAASVTLRRRTGGSDAGWHLELPVAPGVRDEIRAPLSETLPDDLAALVRSRTRGADLVPVVRLRSARALRHLLDADGRLLAEVAEDSVHAQRLHGGRRTAQWTELEVELADDADPALLDRVEKRLRRAGVHPSASPSKLARALEETAPHTPAPPPDAPPRTAGEHVLAYVRAQRDAIVALDPAVRRGTEDSVHAMRVATRRLRSALTGFGTVLDRAVTRPTAAELRWLAAELGVQRDREVLHTRLAQSLADLPPDLIRGPVVKRLDQWAGEQPGETGRPGGTGTGRKGGAGADGTSARLIAVLDSERYLTLLDTLDALLADPPLRPAAARTSGKPLAKAVRKSLAKVSALVGHALELAPGTERDTALHEARKKAKRARYAAEAATPALGDPARALARAMKSLQSLLGEHQDSVMARAALRELAAVAHAAGEDTFTHGLLYGREERRAERVEERLPDLWREITERTTGL